MILNDFGGQKLLAKPEEFFDVKCEGNAFSQ